MTVSVSFGTLRLSGASVRRKKRASESSLTAQRQTRLLLVDDDRLVLATLSEGLRDAGYEVLTASNGREALELARGGEVHLAILDVRMPEMDGVELAAALRSDQQIPFLFLSAYGESEIVREAAEQGALGYLVKPLDIAQIVPAIEASLARACELANLKEAEVRLATALAIEQKTRTAVGLLMEREGLDRDAAFELLRRRARSQRRKIVDVAEELITAAEILNRFSAQGTQRGSDNT